MTRIDEEQLKRCPKEVLLEMIKDRGCFLYMYDGSINEVRIKDVGGEDIYTRTLLDYTGLSFFLQNIKYIDVFENNDYPQINL